MKARSPDTRLEAERVQLELFRRAGPARRFALARSLGVAGARMARRAIRRTHAGISDADVGLLLVANHYGPALAARLRRYPRGGDGDMVPFDIWAALPPVVDAFERLGIPYYVVGSAASVIHGVARMTVDVDLVADLSLGQILPLVERLQDAYYVDAEAIADAVKRRSSFNLVHLGTMFKVDVFLRQDRPYDREVLRRVRQEPFEEGARARTFRVLAAEDVILTKLERYDRGNRASDCQWSDILGVLRVQGEALDLAYLRRWAADLRLAALLEQALADAGLSDPREV